VNYEWSDRDKEVRKEVAGRIESEWSDDIASLASADIERIKETILCVKRRLSGIDCWDCGEDPWPPYAAGFEIARSSTSLFLAIQSARLFDGLVSNFLDSDPGLPDDSIGSVAMSVPADGDYPGTTTAVPDGDSLVLNGFKPFVTNGPFCDNIAVFADIDGREAVCIVSSSQGGVEIGPRLDTMGLDGLVVSSISFKGVRTRPGLVLGPFDDDRASRWFRLRRDLFLADACAGLMHRTLKDSSRHANDRKRNGKPLMARQEVSFKLAEMLTLLQAAELLNNRARWMIRSDHFETNAVVLSARVFGAENAEKVAGAAMQITAGTGYIKGSVSECAYRDARGLCVSGTTIETARMEIADALLERY